MVSVADFVSLTALQVSLKLSNLLEVDVLFSHSPNNLIKCNKQSICQVPGITRFAYLIIDFEDYKVSKNRHMIIKHVSHELDFCIFLVFETNSRRRF